MGFQRTVQLINFVQYNGVNSCVLLSIYTVLLLLELKKVSRTAVAMSVQLIVLY